jgi:hypothetical protein
VCGPRHLSGTVPPRACQEAGNANRTTFVLPSAAVRVERRLRREERKDVQSGPCIFSLKLDNSQNSCSCARHSLPGEVGNCKGYLQERVSEPSRTSRALIHSFFESFRSEAKSGRYITQRSIVQIEQYHKRPSTHRTYCSPNGNGRDRRGIPPPLILSGDDSLPPSEFEAGFQPRGGRRAVTQSSPFFRSFPRTLFSKSTHASTAMFRQDRTGNVSCDMSPTRELKDAQSILPKKPAGARIRVRAVRNVRIYLQAVCISRRSQPLPASESQTAHVATRSLVPFCPVEELLLISSNRPPIACL